MANLDTRNKRASAVGFDLNWLHVYPNPDGALNQADRQQTAYKYPGILSAALATTGITFYRNLRGVGV